MGMLARSWEVNHMLAPSSLFCEPQGVDLVQVLNVFLKYMKDHPEDIHRGGWEMLAIAMQAAFPCGEPNK